MSTYRSVKTMRDDQLAAYRLAMLQKIHDGKVNIAGGLLWPKLKQAYENEVAACERKLQQINAEFVRRGDAERWEL